MKSHIKNMYTLTFLLALMAFSLAARPVLAPGGAGGHLWFYSQEPYSPLPDPITWDPNYIGPHSDPWLIESVVISSEDWETPFTIWLACHQFNSLGTKLVVSINKAANDVIATIKINGSPLTVWDTSGDTPPAGGSPPNKLAPHGVFNSAEFYGYAEADLGDLYSPPGSPYKVAITVDINLKAGATVPANAKIHFDAYGFTDGGSFIFNPYSHDLTFVIPEPATIAAAASSLIAFALYAFKRRRM